MVKYVTPPTDARQQTLVELLIDSGRYDNLWTERGTRWSYLGESAFTFGGDHRKSYGDLPPGPLEKEIITLSILSDQEWGIEYSARTGDLLITREHMCYNDQQKIILEEGKTAQDKNTPRADTLRAVWYWLDHSFGLYAFSLGIYKDSPTPTTKEGKSTLRIRQGLRNLGDQIIQWREGIIVCTELPLHYRIIPKPEQGKNE